MGAETTIIRLVTRCASADEFIARFARFTTETEVVVPAQPHVSVGDSGHFVICLTDRTVMLEGRCEVTEIRPVAAALGGAAAAGPALMRLRLREMDAHSCGIHLRLMERHASLHQRPADAAAPAPLLVEPISSAVAVDVPIEVSEVTVVGGGRPATDTETTEVSPLPRPEARTPGATFTLPANPLSDLDAADLASFVEHTLLEGEAGAAPRRTRTPRIGARMRPAGFARRVAPYASCLLMGIVLGFGLRSGAKPAAAPAPVAAQPAPAEAPESDPPAVRAQAPADTPPTPRTVVAEREPDAVTSERRHRSSSRRRVVSKVYKRRTVATSASVTSSSVAR